MQLVGVARAPPEKERWVGGLIEILPRLVRFSDDDGSLRIGPIRGLLYGQLRSVNNDDTNKSEVGQGVRPQRPHGDARGGGSSLPKPGTAGDPLKKLLLEVEDQVPLAATVSGYFP